MSKGPRLTRRAMLATAAGSLVAPLVLRGGIVRPAHAAAPMMGEARPTHYRFKLGQFEVTTLRDGAIQLDGPHPIFGENQPAERAQEYAQQHFLPPNRMEIGFTPVLVNTGQALVLFDSGNPEARRPGAAHLVSALRDAGYEPGQVDIVVITHMHGDHIGGLVRDGSAVYPNARYVTAEPEYAFWTAEERLSGPTEGTAKLVRANVVPQRPKLTFIGADGEVVPGIRAVQAFGHTPGHMAYHVESDGKRLLIWADTTNHYIMSLQKPEWHVRFDIDKEAAVATRKRIFDMVASDKLLVTGYHMPFPALGYVEKTADGYRWIQASYQMHL